jgi:hypothetical protein
MKGEIPDDTSELGRFLARVEAPIPTAASAVRLREETRGLTGLAAVMVEERVHPPARATLTAPSPCSTRPAAA